MSKLRLRLFLVILVLPILSSSRRTDDNNVFKNLGLTPSSEGNAVELNVVIPGGDVKAHGVLGLSLPDEVGYAQNCLPEEQLPDGDCAQWGDYAKVVRKPGSASNCIRIEWTSSFARELEDCYDLEPSVHWYGGSEMYNQVWPLEKRTREESVCVTANSLGDTEREFGGLVENYWLLSNGASLMMDEDNPLFYSLNNTRRPNRVCFISRDVPPYARRSPLTLNYEWCVGPDVKTVHQQAISSYLGKPRGIPDEGMLVKPFWSTWVRFGFSVNQERVLQFAHEGVDQGFNSSHIEIDDDWESCYGEESFNPDKFPNPKEMIDEIKSLGLRTTVWVHPFMRLDCPSFAEGKEKGYFLKTSNGNLALTYFTYHAGAIDTTNPEAMAWWIQRLERLKTQTGVDSFKFDYGESSFLPAVPSFSSDSKLWPNVYSTRYVQGVSQLGGLIETRLGHRSQAEPVFVRTLDKDSKWGWDNGLRSMIPSVLQFSIVGYPFVLPDMVGGNPRPEKELFIRWMQTNVFFPAMQISTTPWDFDEETVRICKDVLVQRDKYAGEILAAARQAAEDGSPMIRPLWWVDPTDNETFSIDDEYLLGDNILVAPVVYEEQTSRDIYFPSGTWASGYSASEEHVGPSWVRNYPAPLEVVPYFVKTKL